MASTEDPVQELLQPLGVRAEPREVDPIPHIVATGVGSLAGSLLAALGGFGMIGRAVGSIGGAVVAHVLVTHRFTRAPAAEKHGGPESPMAVSDRR